MSIRKSAHCLNALKSSLSSLIWYLYGTISCFKLPKLKSPKCTFFQVHPSYLKLYKVAENTMLFQVAKQN